jgi:Fe-S-cluster-containing dehydrogenase component
VKHHREMHWIKLHRYFMTNKDEASGGLDASHPSDPRIVAQPMMCQHCEAAPCESVCPVNAANHSPEGLNLQVYNRCIGTRYCSNNCPYKARRFNWFDFNKRRLDELRVPTPFSEAGVPETLKMQKNPEVTVRMRGVMEKCTYCIQRIERAKIGSMVLAAKAGADKSNAEPPADPSRAGYDVRQIDGASRIIVPDGIMTTACAQACPTQSIVFGNVRDEQSKVFKLKNAGPDYLALGSLNTKPRTSYLPRLRNLNPRMRGGE